MTTIDELRNRDLVEILEQLAERDITGDRNNWRTDNGGRISLSKDRFKWFDHGNSKGGGGAIDLVMHIRQVEFKYAIEWLQGFTPSQKKAQTIKTSQEPTSQSVVPIPHFQNWDKVRTYLTDKRGIARPVVDKLNKEGIIYADKYENAVFLNYNKSGAELRGTKEGSNFHGYRGKKEAFLLAGDHKKHGLAFCESAIDALSYRVIGFMGTIVSYGGQPLNKMVEVAQQNRDKMPSIKIIAAFDNDHAGQSFADQLQKEITGVIRDVPMNGCKDWNEQLIESLKLDELSNSHTL